MESSLRVDVRVLAGDIGERNASRRYCELQAAADYIDREFVAAGYGVSRQSFTAHGRACDNLEAEIRGATTPDEILVVGAHYDSAPHCPAANDNGSGVAAMLAIARRLARTVETKPPARTVRFVAFVNEEPPYFGTAEMGSRVYAESCRRRHERIVAALSLETIGYYTDAPNSQNYPVDLGGYFPTTGNFVAIVGDIASRGLVREAVASFRRRSSFPVHGAALPAVLDGVGWSDHSSFWDQGYPAVMVTDTAPFRYPYYHTPEDTPDKLNYEAFAQVVEGLAGVVDDLATPLPS